MSNPFTSTTHRYLNEHVKAQMQGIEIDEARMISPPSDTMTKKQLRSMITYAASKLEIAVKTKSDSLGNVWVMRLS